MVAGVAGGKGKGKDAATNPGSVVLCGCHPEKDPARLGHVLRSLVQRVLPRRGGGNGGTNDRGGGGKSNDRGAGGGTNGRGDGGTNGHGDGDTNDHGDGGTTSNGVTTARREGEWRCACERCTPPSAAAEEARYRRRLRFRARFEAMEREWLEEHAAEGVTSARLAEARRDIVRRVRAMDEE